jgi:hypothetical protein
LRGVLDNPRPFPTEPETNSFTKNHFFPKELNHGILSHL